MCFKRTRKQRPARFKKWKVVERKGNSHPHVMVDRKGLFKDRKTVTAKLHLPKPEKDNPENYVYFDRNPNPQNPSSPGAIYKQLRKFNRKDLYDSSKYANWEVSKDGRMKIERRYKEQMKNQKKQKKTRALNKKKKKAIQRRRKARLKRK